MRYDKNEDGLLNAEELHPCIEEYTAHAITQAQCATFLKSIDLSGDGEIDKSEMTHFISEGILLSPAMKQQYAARGEFHKTIVEFFSGVEDHFTRLKNLYSQSMVVHDVQSLLDQIWKIYDAEGRGFLDAASIKLLLKDFTWHDVGQDKCNDFWSVDENGDSVIRNMNCKILLKMVLPLRKEIETNIVNEVDFIKQLLNFSMVSSPDYH